MDSYISDMDVRKFYGNVVYVTDIPEDNGSNDSDLSDEDDVVISTTVLPLPTDYEYDSER